jgi:hypothetical protein
MLITSALPAGMRVDPRIVQPKGLPWTLVVPRLPINLAVDSVDQRQAWVTHLESQYVRHSPVIQGGAGHLLTAG